MGIINAFCFPVFDFFAKNKWAQIALLIAVSAGAYLIWLGFHDAKVREKERLKQKIEAARQQARIAQTKQDIQQETSDERRKADEAVRDLPELTYGELRDRAPIHTIVFGRPPAGAESAEGGGLRPAEADARLGMDRADRARDPGRPSRAER